MSRSNEIKMLISSTGKCPELGDNDLAILEQELLEILNRMASCDTYDGSIEEWNQLIELHGIFATLLFKFSVDLTDRQSEFVKIFDRWDDVDTRKYFFNEVKLGRL